MSHTSNVYAHLAEGKTLTSMEAWRKWNCTRLADTIHELRTRYGFNIHTKMVKEGRSRYAVYSLSKRPWKG
jgi:hypothetical protein